MQNLKNKRKVMNEIADINKSLANTLYHDNKREEKRKRKKKKKR